MVNLPDKPVILLGFMGSGKSTLGFQLAEKLGWNFTDLDHYIETVSGMEIPRIFGEMGELRFREMESLALKEVLAGTGQVIAIGGGAPCTNDNMTLIKAKSRSVYLKISVDELFSRLANSLEKRPLIAGKTEQDLRSFISNLLKSREFFYNQADFILESDHITMDQLHALISKNV